MVISISQFSYGKKSTIKKSDIVKHIVGICLESVGEPTLVVQDYLVSSMICLKHAIDSLN